MKKYFWFSQKHKGYLLSPSVLSTPTYFDNLNGSYTLFYSNPKLHTFEGKEFTLQTDSIEQAEKYKQNFEDYILIGSCEENERDWKVVYQPPLRKPYFQ